MKREPAGRNSVGPLQFLFSATFFDEVTFIPCGPLRIGGSPASIQEFEACLSGGLIKHESWLFHVVLACVIPLYFPLFTETRIEIRNGEEKPEEGPHQFARDTMHFS